MANEAFHKEGGTVHYAEPTLGPCENAHSSEAPSTISEFRRLLFLLLLLLPLHIYSAYDLQLA